MMTFNQLFSREQAVVPKRGVHLDLKGLPPTADRLVELLKLFAAARYNVVLVEWEDSFPWTVDQRFRSPTAYTPDDIRRFTDAARALGLELIPLVTCLGHMETPLSVPGYEHLRELPDQAASLNPLHPGSRELIQRMVDDVLKLMPETRCFHLGGDESWTFGKNPETGAYIKEHGKGALYLAHVEPILDALNARGIRPILWHDMMIDWDSNALKSLARKSDLMTWGYIGHPDASHGQHGTEHFRRFHEHGIVLWGATAYKGCEAGTVERHTSDRPDLPERQENALAWTEIARRFGYAGVVATAWSRWSVDTLQCVPIDAALDAMILVGVILHDGHPPAGGVAACVDAMEEPGERARFEACRKAMERLTDVRRRGWQMVQFARQQLVLARRAPRRISARERTMGFKVVPQLGEIVRESEGIAAEVRRSFAGLLEPIWIEEYLATRLVPLREEFEALEQVIFGREPGFDGEAADVPARRTGCGRREDACPSSRDMTKEPIHEKEKSESDVTAETFLRKDGILIESESFEDCGGWRVDTQFIHSMGSPYLLAHGLGRPVAPARTTITLPTAGRWFVWARTKNWAPGPWEAPGRFMLAVNGRELPHVFGAGDGEWSWESGGAVELDHSAVSFSLIDLTGFDARCDAIFLTQDESAVPDNSSEPMSAWRRRCATTEDRLDAAYDLVVVGGGLAGTSAAIAASRAGLRVALLQNRSVLGGNASHEIQVAPSGEFPPGRYPNLGDIVRELILDRGHAAELHEQHSWYCEADEQRRRIVAAEPNLDLFLDHHVYDVEARGARIVAVWALHTQGGLRRRIGGRFFVDATGHGTVGLQAGADYHMEPRDRMGMTNIWRWGFTAEPSPFPETPWALPLTEKDFPYPTDGGWVMEEGKTAKPMRPAPLRNMGKGDWHWESGFNKHPLNDLEAIRDHNLRAAFGAFNAMKNHGAYASLDVSGRAHATARLFWMACIGGTRETLQLLGDVVVCEDDIYANRDFPDGCVPATWGIDLHFPMPLYARQIPGNPFISRAHFDGRVDDSQGEWADSPKSCVMGKMRDAYDRKKGYLFPYRAFYSRNIENLFMAGRDLSVTHEALGTIRVMNTLGMVGVVVGRAASIACRHGTTPRGVYEHHLEELKDLLAKPGHVRTSEMTITQNKRKNCE